METFRYLDVSGDRHLLTLTINNPPNNSLPSFFFRELFGCFERIQDPDVHAVIITGKGRNFSKGADLRELQEESAMLEEPQVLEANRIFSFIAGLNKPVIAAINGACFGGGLELALACHIRLCSEKAWLGLPEVSAGLVPGLGGIPRLSKVVGEAKALEMILLGDMISAEEAQRLNLVSRVFPKKDFMVHVHNFVKTLLAAPREAIAEVLGLFSLYGSSREEELIRTSSEAFCRLAKRRRGK